MPDHYKEILEVVKGITPAIAGGGVSYLYDKSKNGDEFSLLGLGIRVFIAAVVGSWVMGFISTIDYFSTREALQGSIVGISSFLSPKILDLLIELFPIIARKYLKKKDIT